jgi:hypothetical protein
MAVCAPAATNTKANCSSPYYFFMDERVLKVSPVYKPRFLFEAKSRNHGDWLGATQIT